MGLMGLGEGDEETKEEEVSVVGVLVEPEVTGVVCCDLFGLDVATRFEGFLDEPEEGERAPDEREPEREEDRFDDVREVDGRLVGFGATDVIGKEEGEVELENEDDESEETKAEVVNGANGDDGDDDEILETEFGDELRGTVDC